jgi:hypothetical protein
MWDNRKYAENELKGAKQKKENLIKINQKKSPDQ